MKKYEIMYILRANLEQEAIKAEIDYVGTRFTKNGSKVLETKEWGLRDLAYEINKDKKGYYVVIEASVSSSSVVDEFARRAKFNANVLRHLVIAK